MTKENIDFLINLQKTLNTQDHDCQAEPRYWAVGENYREWGISPGYADGSAIVDLTEGDILGETVDDVLKYLKDNGLIDDEETTDLRSEDFIYCDNLDDVIDILKIKNYKNVDIRWYRDIHRIAENTMFITKQECVNHIKRNDYHYRNPHTYAMTAWRSPEIEKLYKILKETNWAELLDRNGV